MNTRDVVVKVLLKAVKAFKPAEHLARMVKCNVRDAVNLIHRAVKGSMTGGEGFALGGEGG